jgi:hypothetical protein
MCGAYRLAQKDSASGPVSVGGGRPEGLPPRAGHARHRLDHVGGLPQVPREVGVDVECREGPRLVRREPGAGAAPYDDHRDAHAARPVERFDPDLALPRRVPASLATVLTLTHDASSK